jgi:serine/threonine protein kinase
MPLTSGARLGRYEVSNLIGAGGMGEVYRARDTRLGRDVALKVLPDYLANDASRRRRFELEARAVAALNHPNILAVYDVGDENGIFYIVSELVDGESLRGAKLGLRKTVETVAQIASGLGAAHDAGVVHRDIKPSNILLLRDGRAKILDFGLAKLHVAQPTEVTGPSVATETLDVKTEQGIVMGTVGYMSPEQVRGLPADQRSDIFSVGVILYELLTRKRAFKGETAADTMQAILRHDPPELPETVPAGIRQILQHCLEKAPINRFQSARDLGFALTALSQSGSHSVDMAPVSSKPLWHRPLTIALIAIALIGLAVGLFALRAPPSDQWSGVQLGGPDIALNPRLSPDGHLLAFQAMVDGLTQVAVMKPESGNWTILTRRRGHGSVQDISWSPDGALIYFDRSTDVPEGAYSIPVLGGEERLLLENASHPVPLPDGTVLVGRPNAQREMQLFRLYPETGRLQDLPVLLGSEPSYEYSVFPRDGRHVLVRGRTLDGNSRKPAFLELDPATATVRRLAESETAPRTWTPTRDGMTIIMASAAGSLLRILTMPVDGSAPAHTLFTVSHDVWFMDAGTDGSVYLSLSERPSEVVRLSPRGGSPERIAAIQELPLIDELIALPDGRAVVTLQVAGRIRLVVVEKGKDPAPLVNTTEETAAPITLAGPHTIAFAIGPSPHETIALADTGTGRITGRIHPGKGEFNGLAATPDGKTLYFAAGPTIWSVPAAGGDVRKVTTGEDVVMDPAGPGLVVARKESSRITLWRMSLDGGSERLIPINNQVRLLPNLQSPGGIHADGRMLVSMGLLDSWFNPPGLLDIASGHITRLLSDVLNDYHSLAWMPDGQIIATRQGLHSSLWKFMPERK